MPKARPPYPPEFRQQMVELVRAGRSPEELSREFEPSVQATRNRVVQADPDEGRRSDGLTSADREELRRLLGVSADGYYAWQGRAPSARAESDATLLKRIREIHADSRGTDEAPRIHAELAGEGVRVGRKRVARLMRDDRTLCPSSGFGDFPSGRASGRCLRQLRDVHEVLTTEKPGGGQAWFHGSRKCPSSPSSRSCVGAILNL